MTKREKFAAWMSEHTGDMIVGAVYTAVAALGVAAVVAAYKAEQRQQDELKQAVSEGKTVLPGPEGMWWILPGTSQEVA